MTSRHAQIWSWVFVGTLFAFLFMPVLMVVLFSFNSAPSTTLPFKGFSLHWYHEAFSQSIFTEAIKESILVALLTGLVVTAIGTAASFAISRHRSRILDLFTWFVMVPAVLPGLFLAVALLSFYNETHTQLSFLTVVVGHTLVTLPFTVLIVNARLAEFDRSLEEAARDCGATAAQAFVKIVLPIVRPALFGSLLIGIAWSIDEIVIALFTVGAQPTLPVTVWGLLRRSIDPSINAIASAILATTVLSTLIARRFISAVALAR